MYYLAMITKCSWMALQLIYTKMKNQVAQKNRVKLDLIVIGNPNSGKTSLVRRFIEGQPISFNQFYNPTLGLSLEKKIIQVDNNEVTVCIWDTAGQEKFFSLTKNYFKKADGVLVVFDITDKNSFERIEKFWINEIKEKSDQNCSQILIGNKSDISEERAVSEQESSEMAERLSIKYFQTSAKTGTNVDNSITFLVEQCLKKVKEESNGSGVNLAEQKKSTNTCTSFFKDILGKFKS